MNALRGRHREDGRGQILILFALGLVVFIGFAALTVDIGSLYVARRNYQNVTDAAALAGAAFLTRPINDNCVDGSGGTSKPECARRGSLGLRQRPPGPWVVQRTGRHHAAIDTPAAGRNETPTGGGAAYTIWISTPPNGAARSPAGRRRAPSRPPSRSSSCGWTASETSSSGRSLFRRASTSPPGRPPASSRTATRSSPCAAGAEHGDRPGPANTTDMKTAGTNSELNVVNGDVGGNWGMKLTAGSLLKVYSTTGDEANVYLIDNVSCGNSCWSPGQLRRRTRATRSPAKKLPGFVQDPNYPAPPIPGATWPNGPVDNTAPSLDIPNGDTAASHSAVPHPASRSPRAP